MRNNKSRLEPKIFNTRIKPTWCSGCANFGIFTALKQALVNLKLEPHQVVVTTDVGCSGNMADFINCYGLHALHGRAIPPAVGIKLANHRLSVICVIGDGGCYGEGLTHFINLMRGNHDITVLVHDNFLYSLTTGQYSPTTPKGTKTKSTPFGAIEEALNPLALSVANHATFAARGYAFEVPHLTNLIGHALEHKGFALVDILQPCLTFNKAQALDWYQKRVYRLKKSFSDKTKAFQASLEKEKLGIGVFWQEKKPSYHEQEPILQKETLVKKPITKINIAGLIKEFI